MKIRPYLTFDGECQEAIDLYNRAFQTEPIQLMRFMDLPPGLGFPVPEEYKNRIVQCTLKIGDDFFRLSDCGPAQQLNAPESERVSLAIEASTEEVQYAFKVLAEEGRVSMPLAETFYSPCTGVVFDKFGVMWSLVGEK